MTNYSATVELEDGIWVFFEGSKESILGLQRAVLDQFSPDRVSVSLLGHDPTDFQIGFCFKNHQSAMLLKLSF